MGANTRSSKRPNVALPTGGQQQVHHDRLCAARIVFDRDGKVTIGSLANEVGCSRSSAKQFLATATFKDEMMRKAVNHYVFPEDV